MKNLHLLMIKTIILLLTNKISNRFLTTIKANNLNNIITIYNQNNIVSYIATTKNRRGDLFIITNTENYENDTSRFIYAIKSDETNFFNDNTDSYITLNVSVASNNEFPMISSIIINEKEYIVSLSHNSDFEIYDFENKISSNLNIFLVTNTKAAIS